VSEATEEDEEDVDGMPFSEQTHAYIHGVKAQATVSASMQRKQLHLSHEKKTKQMMGIDARTLLCVKKLAKK
jgi:hypothetical protein